MNRELRSHPSSIFTDNVFFSFLLGFFTIDLIKEIRSIKEVKDFFINIMDYLGYLLLVIILIFLISFLIGFIKWRVTFLVIDGNKITVSKRGLFKKRLDFKASDIASININKNIFQRIFKTSTLKFDLNNSIESFEGKIKFIFKDELCEEVKRALLMNEAKEIEEEEDYKILKSFNTSDAIIYSLIRDLNVTNLIIGIVIISGTFFAGGNSKLKLSTIIFGGALLALKMSYEFIKNSLNYSNFKVYRKDDKVLLKYGFFNRKEYSFLLSKVSGIKIYKTFLGRILKKSFIEVIVVGMANDENERAAISLCIDDSEVKSYLEDVIDDFEVGGEKIKPPKESFKYSLGKSLIIFIVLNIIALSFSKVIALIISLIIAVIILLSFIEYKTDEVKIDEEKLLIKVGKIDKVERRIYIKKIQTLKIKSDIYEMKKGLRRAEITNVSDIKDLSINIPRIDEADMERVKGLFK
ncbi:PH domain-containing protein [Clostridium sp. LY3-2]|uniref:PH domain-containing protein n=1 Tax=Clostridium sp. LY3-2 TaxID=2942482 RepID=UPI0021533035|nr:PH domain-containing protein [Clostridium sp. LY3-2]MCR6515211.1 PH domain-containing protein [Clostridium sp. LY3-2]